MLQSGDREDRIAARRARVKARIAVQREGEQDGTKKEVSIEKDVGKGPRQMVASRRRIQRVRENYQQKVTRVRVEEDERESRRRVDEETRRQELRAKVLGEAEASARRNTTVAMGWTDVLLEKTPQGLKRETEKQRTACKEIVLSKNSVIDEIKVELTFKDDEYVKALKRQADVIDRMIQHMAIQTAEVQQAVRDELEEVEAAFLHERSEILQAHQEELNNLIDKRGKLEQAFMEAQLERADGFQQDLEELRVQDAEDYNILKVKLEKDIQNLEQHLEAMRATYQLNTEKLEYNYRVLVEREQENQSTISAQKRKVAQQRDILSTLKSRYTESEKRFLNENTKLTEEYRRITEQFKDLQVKFKHFEKADVTRYQEIWYMNGETVRELVSNVLKADKVIHEQLLGLEHQNPSEETFRSPAEEADEDKDAEANQAGEEEVSQKRQQLLDKLSTTKYSKLLDALQEQLPFMRSTTSPGLQSLLATLGVTDGSSFDSLVEGLVKEGGLTMSSLDETEALELETDDATEARNAMDRETGSEGEQGYMLETNDNFLQALRQHLEKEGISKDAIGKSQATAVTKSQLDAQKLDTTPNKTQSENEGGSGSAVSATTVEALAQRLPQKVDREREYWHRMANVISAKMHRIWLVLKKELLSFNDILTKRGNLLTDIKDLAEQNAELRDLLNKYLSSKINEDLHIPPTQMLLI